MTEAIWSRRLAPCWPLNIYRALCVDGNLVAALIPPEVDARLLYRDGSWALVHNPGPHGFERICEEHAREHWGAT